MNYYAPHPVSRYMPVCGNCPRCHPGRQWGGDERCTRNDCTCHRREGRP